MHSTSMGLDVDAACIEVRVAVQRLPRFDALDVLRRDPGLMVIWLTRP